MELLPWTPIIMLSGSVDGGRALLSVPFQTETLCREAAKFVSQAATSNSRIGHNSNAGAAICVRNRE